MFKKFRTTGEDFNDLERRVRVLEEQCLYDRRGACFPVWPQRPCVDAQYPTSPQDAQPDNAPSAMTTRWQDFNRRCGWDVIEMNQLLTQYGRRITSMCALDPKGRPAVTVVRVDHSAKCPTLTMAAVDMIMDLIPPNSGRMLRLTLEDGEVVDLCRTQDIFNAFPKSTREEEDDYPLYFIPANAETRTPNIIVQACPK